LTFNSTSSGYAAFRGRGNIFQVFSHSLNSYRTFCASLLEISLHWFCPPGREMRQRVTFVMRKA